MAKSHVQKYPADRIRRQLKYFPHRRGIRSKASAIVAAIRDDWPKPDGYREPPKYADLSSRREYYSAEEWAARRPPDVSAEAWIAKWQPAMDSR